MFFLEGKFVRLKEVSVLGLADGKGKGLDYLMEGLFIFVREEIEENLSKKVLLDARTISL